MKPKTKKPKGSDKDTVVAYHEFVQGRIQDELNGVDLGPGRLPCTLAKWVFGFGFCCLIVGILVVALRKRHVYLWDWNDQFLGPFFVIMFFLCGGLSTWLIIFGKRRANAYRRELVFRPKGDYGVMVVHKSVLSYDVRTKSDLKSGTTPHNVKHPYRHISNDPGGREYRRDGYDNRGYKNDRNGQGYRPEERRRPDEDRRRRPDDEDRRRRPDDEDRRRRRPEDEERRRRRPEDDDRRGREGDRRRYEDDPKRQEHERRRQGEGRRREDDRRRPPEDPEERARYEEERRRRHDEERRRRKERMLAEEEENNRRRPPPPPVVPPDSTVEVRTTVTLSKELQDTNESEL